MSNFLDDANTTPESVRSEGDRPMEVAVASSITFAVELGKSAV